MDVVQYLAINPSHTRGGGRAVSAFHGKTKSTCAFTGCK